MIAPVTHDRPRPPQAPSRAKTCAIAATAAPPEVFAASATAFRVSLGIAAAAAVAAAFAVLL